ncbi:MAG: FadR family transcriptional regulator [Alphaproteobacteria bacterium]|nr:FadR family transcriptional regulator [Alphaproteobacteria bacterium]
MNETAVHKSLGGIRLSNVGLSGGSMNAAAIYARIRNDIIRMKYLNQDQLPPERILAKRFGVARGTIRNALSTLEQEGLVARRRGSGTYVCFTAGSYLESIIEITSPMQLIEARMAFEPHAARVAALNASEQDRQILREKVLMLENNDEGQPTFSILDEQFHRTLVQSTRNALLIGLYHFLESVRAHQHWNRMKRITLTDENMSMFNVQHREIMEAVVGMRVETAGELVKKHLMTVQMTLQSS